MQIFPQLFINMSFIYLDFQLLLSFNQGSKYLINQSLCKLFKSNLKLKKNYNKAFARAKSQNLKSMLLNQSALELSKAKFIITLCIFLCLIQGTSQQCKSYSEYYDSNLSLCLPCTYNCLTCLDSTTCVLCADQYYIDLTSNLCNKCLFGCQVCSAATSCDTCNTGLYINAQGNCIPCAIGVSSCSIAVVQSCHDGYFLLGSICAGCLDSCKTCTDFVTCDQCQLGYYLSTNKQMCTICMNNCQICIDANICTSCNPGYSIVSNACAAQNCLNYPFCTSCTSSGCLACQQGKYLAANGSCIQGASILCKQSIGPYFTNCKTDGYGCPDYGFSQIDPFTSLQMGICLPYSTSQYQQYIYFSSILSSCLSSTCSNPLSKTLTIVTRQSYYSLRYSVNIRLYSSSSHVIKISSLNSTNSTQVLANNTHTISISQELSILHQAEVGCSGCNYGQVVIQGKLKSNGYGNTYILISDTNAAFTITQYVFIFLICKINNCQTCTTSSDCVLCVQPYFLQLTTCVDSCDAGFYKYQRSCVIQCSQATYAIQSSYQCQNCLSPCQTCSSSSECRSCLSGYFLQNSSCVTSCISAQYFGNITSRSCQICPNPCATCQSISPTLTKCLSCNVGYLFNGKSCVFNCPTGLYTAFTNYISQCKTCQAQCSSCYIQDTICEGCNTGYLLYDNYCNQTAACLPGFYVTTNNICASCQFPCATCITTTTKCTTCLKGALYNYQCLINCPNGYFTSYSQISNISCIVCLNNCKTCISDTYCTSCNAGRYLYNNQCLTSCPLNKFYENSSNNTCSACVPPCKQCTTSSSCLSCLTGYLDVTICTLKCNITSYISSSFVCTLCVAPCFQCYSSTQCIQCTLPYVLYNSTCITITACEGYGKYVAYTLNPITNLNAYGQCRECTYPCVTCKSSSIACVTCATGYLIVSDLKTCAQICPITYYQSVSQCLKCNSNCYQCSSTSTKCTSCSSGFYLNSATSICVSICPSGTYSDNQSRKCLTCVAPCATCYNIYFCKSCISGILYNKVCLTACPSGTIYSSSSNQCMPCTNNCLTCTTITSNCTACISGYYYNSDNTCTSTCVPKFYADSYTQTCANCISPCVNCISSNQCISCITGFYLMSTNCMSACPDGYFANTITLTCDTCNLTICGTCKTNKNNCLTCSVGYFYDSTASLCVTSCPLSYYPSLTSRTCQTCQFPCTTCKNTSFCMSCQTNYKLFKNRCYSSCPIGYYSTNTTSTCTQCSINCLICTSGISCSKCDNLYYVENGLCATSCSFGLFKGQQDITNYDACLLCPITCASCINFNNCTSCVSGLFLFNGICLDNCPILHYQRSSDLTCQLCSSFCVSCLNSTYCIQCINSYLYNHTCYSTCPSQTYIFNDVSCVNCVSPCKQCASQFTCINCVQGYFYYGSYCVTKCPTGVWYYPHNDTCTSTCPNNKYEAMMYCYIEGCGGRLVQSNTYCIENCPSGHYVSLNQSCKSCSSNEALCKNLFVADLQILKSDKLSLSLYFSQKAQLISSISQIQVLFTDSQSQLILNISMSSYSLTQYSLTLTYNYTSLSLTTVSVTIPYITSQQTQQSINTNKYSSTIYYYNDYSSEKESGMYSLVGMIGLLFSVGLFLIIVVNFVAKISPFLQLLDFMQLIAACLYLDIQYPLVLQNFLDNMGYIIFKFMPKLMQTYPYTFSSPKFIFHNIDTSFSRNHLLTFIIFILLISVMLIILKINKQYPQKLVGMVNRIKYRNLNDIFSLFTFPLLLFAFSLRYANIIDILFGILIIIVTLTYIVFISNLIISASNMRDLKGLLSDYQAVSSKLGLMYLPFAYIRRFIVALVFCMFANKPLATLTLLLIFTILILICLFFYQPFQSRVTDYVSIYMESSLCLVIIMLVLIGLDVMGSSANQIIAILIIIVTTIAMVVGFGWLINLTFNGVRKFCQNPDKEEIDKQKCIRDQKQSHKNNNQPNQNEQNQNSANQLISQAFGKPYTQDIYSENQTSNKQQFKHWDDGDDEDEQNSEQKDNKQGMNQDKRPPQLLMKKIIQNNQPQNKVQTQQQEA